VLQRVAELSPECSSSAYRFHARVINEVTEGINTKIKLLKRIAYGLHDFAHIGARILMEFAPEIAIPS
jgi:hypothetical protein